MNPPTGPIPNPAGDKPQATLLQVMRCPQCEGALYLLEGRLTCQDCQRAYPLHQGIPLFTDAPQGLQPSEKIPRGPNLGTPWRQANWRFLESQVRGLPEEALILDVGAGRGDFADLLAGRQSIALDVYPYPEVDLVCDLAQLNPFKPASFEAILLMNVLEHIYGTHDLLTSLSQSLKPGGLLIVAIPFMVKMHQIPVDYARYTHYALQRLGDDHGLACERLEGYYDPVFLLGEGIGNLKWGVLPAIRGGRHYAGRATLWAIQQLAGVLKSILGPGQLQPPAEARSQAPIGYHIVYRKR
jgi:SAM-dependent methyltransferase